LKLWRITTRKWALDKQCDGARLYGGRWNPPGYPVMYAGTTIEICALEKFVHLASAAHPPLVLVSIDVPDDEALFLRPGIADLPEDWAQLPAPGSAQEFGRNWIDAAGQLAMFLPSAIIPEAANVMINPRHPAYEEVKLDIVRDFRFDARMMRFAATGTAAE
jgi:RES domain-containing protein